MKQMKLSQPTSVLIFLGVCLGFAEALAGVVGHLSPQVDGGWILVDGSFNLCVILFALLYMFHRKPEFLVAERGDVVPLRLVEVLSSLDDPGLAQDLLRCLTEYGKVGQVDIPADEPAISMERSPTEPEEEKLASEQAKIATKD